MARIAVSAPGAFRLAGNAATGAAIGATAATVRAQTAAPAPAPETRTYKTVGDVQLKAYIYSPPDAASQRPRPAAVLLHGGGWSMGSPEWMSARARRLAALGMVAVAVQYRLSDRKAVTPVEAMADVRDAIRWMRRHAASLGLDPNRIAALGVSAGGHLAASAAIFPGEWPADSVSAAPNALVLWYPALSLAQDRWVQDLLGDRTPVASISPAEHVRPGLPPTLILQGANDSLTTRASQQRFCERMRRAGNRCELHVYPGLGHLFMKNPWGEGEGEPDAVARADAAARAERFLASLDYIALPAAARPDTLRSTDRP